MELKDNVLTPLCGKGPNDLDWAYNILYLQGKADDYVMCLMCEHCEEDQPRLHYLKLTKAELREIVGANTPVKTPCEGCAWELHMFLSREYTLYNSTAPERVVEWECKPEGHKGHLRYKELEALKEQGFIY